MEPEKYIAIHVIGSGYGESIIIELPNRELVIVDPYCDYNLGDTGSFANVNRVAKSLFRNEKTGIRICPN